MHGLARSISYLLFGGLSAAVMTGPASSAPETITLKVPVQMKEMVAPGVRVDCEIYGEDGATNIAKEFNTGENAFPIPNGEFDQVVEMVLTPQTLGAFAGAKSYRCTIKVVLNYPDTYAQATPEVGTPSSGVPIFRLARPDRFFRAVVTGQLTGTPFAGPKGLLQTPQPPVGTPKTIQPLPKATLKQ